MAPAGFLFKVQDCGCIALPEELQQQSGLNPGATFQMEMGPNGGSILIHSIQNSEKPNPATGASCETPLDRL